MLTISLLWTFLSRLFLWTFLLLAFGTCLGRVASPIALIFVVEPKDVLVHIKEAFLSSVLILDTVAFILVEFAM